MHKVWAAVTKNKPHGILAIGIGAIYNRFDPRCFRMDNFTHDLWVADGAKYCQLELNYVIPVVNSDLNNLTPLNTFGHGEIRTCKSVHSILGLLGE